MKTHEIRTAQPGITITFAVASRSRAWVRDGAKMYEWFERFGFTVDRGALAVNSDVAFHG
jgi:hypothetical protein